MTESKGLPIEVQAAAALILIQLAHKLVAELPGAMTLAGTTAHPMVFAVITLSVAYIIAGIPKDPPYYILFPILQGILLTYFCRLGYQAVKTSRTKEV
ncbi:hypothetical protein DRP53_03790 [candidate division WOR-3 bacterium]|uniref:Uncharacterized protein n=1 Tax=candidate division WOR-3 bacterium TaxID=2052148 RepID=A0A660SIY3_UNCW3|nr:MAG: hypothetical protein DRP53_03790 [candidate division WOR-3 bacterium]